MRIAISTMVDQPDVKSGVGQVVTNLLSELQIYGDNHEYNLLTFSNDNTFTAKERPDFHIIKSRLHSASSWQRILWNQTALPYFIKKNRIDVLHIPVADLFVKACPTVVTIEDLAEYHLSGKYSPTRMRYRKLILPVIARRADHIITVSETSKADIMKFLKVPDDKISVIYHGINSRFKPMIKTDAQKAMMQKYDIEGPYLLYVGRIMHPSKNLVKLIHAYHSLKTAGRIPHRLILAGKNDWGHEEVHRTVKDLGLCKEVIFTGYVPDDDLPLFYNAADALVFVSLHEGFGMPVTEAMACGLPVITSNTSSLKEIAGEAGLLTDPHSTDAVAHCIETLISDKNMQEDLSKKGLQRSLIFSWQKTAKDYIRVYETLASQNIRH